jgi:hypothetical protein
VGGRPNIWAPAEEGSPCIGSRALETLQNDISGILDLPGKDILRQGMVTMNEPQLDIKMSHRHCTEEAFGRSSDQLSLIGEHIIPHA